MPEADVPVSFTVHSMPRPGVDDDARRTASGRLKMLLVLAVCAAPVIASYVAYFVLRPEARTNYAALIEPQRPIPADLPLTTLDGAAVAPAALAGNWQLVVVAGGACDAACERQLWLVRQLREMAGRDRDRIDKIWLVSDDAPLRPQTRAAVDAAPATRVLRVPATALAGWLAPEPGHRLADHLYVIDPLGNWMMRVPADGDPNRFKRDLERLLRASAGWQQPRR